MERRTYLRCKKTELRVLFELFLRKRNLPLRPADSSCVILFMGRFFLLTQQVQWSNDMACRNINMYLIYSLFNCHTCTPAMCQTWNAWTHPVLHKRSPHHSQRDQPQRHVFTIGKRTEPKMVIKRPVCLTSGSKIFCLRRHTSNKLPKLEVFGPIHSPPVH